MILGALISLIVLLHIYFLILEMFLWAKPYGLRVFNQSLEQAQASKILAANQGLYNGFLAAGLIWGLIEHRRGGPFDIEIFFISCVIVAGVYGGLTVNRKIFFIQALPAILALALIVSSNF